MADDLEDLVAEFGEECHDAVIAAHEATEQIVRLLPEADLSELGRTNFAALDFNWESYLRASQSRIVLLVKTLREAGARSGRVLDQGALFGNFSLALQRLGYSVVASDFYQPLAGALAPWQKLLKDTGVEVADSSDYCGNLPFANASFDAVLSMSVIEHIPGTPRRHLLDLARCLKMNGLFLLETPNLAYQYKREGLNAGQGIFFPIEAQFESRNPFSGHYREYVAAELEWMLRRIGMTDLRTAYLDYSYRVLPVRDQKTTRDLEFRRQHPHQRELILCSGRKAQAVADGPDAPPVASADSVEGGFHPSALAFLQRRLAQVEESRQALARQYETLQAEINKRDELLRKLQSEHNALYDQYRSSAVAHAEARGQAASLAQRLEESKAAAAELRGIIENQQAIITRQQSAVEQLQAAAVQQQTTIEQQHASIEQQRGSIEQQRIAGAQQQELLAQQQKISAEQLAVIVRQQATIEQQHASIEQQRGMIEQFRMAAARHESEINGLQQESRELMAQIGFLTPRTLPQRAAFRVLWPGAGRPNGADSAPK